MREITVKLVYLIVKGLKYQPEDFIYKLALSRPQGEEGS